MVDDCPKIERAQKEERRKKRKKRDFENVSEMYNFKLLKQIALQMCVEIPLLAGVVATLGIHLF